LEGQVLPSLPARPARVLLLLFEMDETSPVVEQQSEPLIPAEPAPPITSRFLFVDVAALRAKQIRRGARQRLGEDAHLPIKAERVAMEEVKRGLVYYDVPPPKPPRGNEEPEA